MSLPLETVQWPVKLAGSFLDRLPGRRKPAARLQRHLKPLHLPEISLAAVAGDAKPLQPLQGPSQLSGRWKKDRSQSDSMEEACNVMQLPWVFRKAVLTLNNMQVTVTDEYFRTAAKVAGIIDLVEQYPWDGSSVKHPRRDKRRGHHTGRVLRAPNGATLQYEWPPPLGGSGVDEFEVSEDGRTLTVATTMHIAEIDRHCSYSG